jgi:hypothetical protein
VYGYLAGSWDPVYVKDLTTGVTSDLDFAGGLLWTVSLSSRLDQISLNRFAPRSMAYRVVKRRFTSPALAFRLFSPTCTYRP